MGRVGYSDLHHFSQYDSPSPRKFKYIVHKLLLVNCMETYKEQKQIATEVFNIYVGDLVIH